VSEPYQIWAIFCPSGMIGAEVDEAAADDRVAAARLAFGSLSYKWRYVNPYPPMARTILFSDGRELPIDRQIDQKP